MERPIPSKDQYKIHLEHETLSSILAECNFFIHYRLCVYIYIYIIHSYKFCVIDLAITKPTRTVFWGYFPDLFCKYSQLIKIS